MLNMKSFALAVVVLMSVCLKGSHSDDTKATYLVPYKWKGRTDWRVAQLMTDMGSDVVVQVDEPGSLPIQFSKQEVAVNKKLRDKKAFIGMEVLARYGSDLDKRPLYGFGIISSRLRPQQYTVQFRCESKAMPLGVGAQRSSRVKAIPDGQMTASSVYTGYPPHQGRLGNEKVWCPSRKAMRKSWLQVDLGAPHYICSVAAHGDRDKGQEWTKTYTLSMSNDGAKFTYLRQDDGAIKNLPASREGTESGVEGVKIPYRYLRFSPTSYNKFPCLGVEVYGIGPVQSLNPSQELNVDDMFPLGDPLVPYLLVPYAWKGRTDWRLARLISHRGTDVSVKMFPGTSTPVQYSSRDIVLNVPPRADSLHMGSPVFAPFSKDKDGVVMFAVGRVSFSGTGGFLITPLCSRLQKALPIGVGIPSTLLLDRVTSLPDSHLSATSAYPGFPAKHGRHGNRLVWCAANDALRSSTFQIDLGGLYVICSVVVQGHADAKEWVTSFKISMSADGRRWKVIQDTKGKQIYQRSGHEPAEIHLGLKKPYKHVMFTPVKYNNRPCMGVELYGVGPLSKPSNMFTPQELRIQGNICELDHECPSDTKCMPGSVPGAYTCKCREGYMSSEGGLNIKPGTPQHCRTINPTGKAVALFVEMPPEDTRTRSTAAMTTLMAGLYIVTAIVVGYCY